MAFQAETEMIRPHGPVLVSALIYHGLAENYGLRNLMQDFGTEMEKLSLRIPPSRIEADDFPRSTNSLEELTFGASRFEFVNLTTLDVWETVEFEVRIKGAACNKDFLGEISCFCIEEPSEIVTSGVLDCSRFFVTTTTTPAVVSTSSILARPSTDQSSSGLSVAALVSIVVVVTLTAVLLLVLFSRRAAAHRMVGVKTALPMYTMGATEFNDEFGRLIDDHQLWNLKYRSMFVPSQAVTLTSLVSTGDGRWRDALWSSDGSGRSAVFAPRSDLSALERDGKRLLLMEHPHVIELLGLVAESPGPGLLLETASKTDLRTFLRRHKPDPLKPQTDEAFEGKDLLTAVQQITSALSFFESKGIAHGRVRARFLTCSFHQLTVLPDACL